MTQNSFQLEREREDGSSTGVLPDEVLLVWFDTTEHNIHYVKKKKKS